MEDTAPQDNESIDNTNNQPEEEDYTVAEWTEILADRLSDGENLKEITATIREIAANRARLDRERLGVNSRVVRLQTWLRFMVVLLALSLFAAGGWIYSDDTEIVRLLIVSFVSFLGGTVAGSARMSLGQHTGRRRVG